MCLDVTFCAQGNRVRCDASTIVRWRYTIVYWQWISHTKLRTVRSVRCVYILSFFLSVSLFFSINGNTATASVCICVRRLNPIRYARTRYSWYMFHLKIFLANRALVDYQMRTNFGCRCRISLLYRQVAHIATSIESAAHTRASHAHTLDRSFLWLWLSYKFCLNSHRRCRWRPNIRLCSRDILWFSFNAV